MKTLTLCAGLALLTSPALAQSPLPYRNTPPDETLGITQNNTGGRADVVISRGPTGADTITSDSAAGGNAGRPELRIPNGSAGGGGGGGNR